MNNNYILGLHIGLHDSSAALIRCNKIIAMAEQERFSRRKIAEREAPIDATLFCLNVAGITLTDVEAIALGMDWDLRDSLLEFPNGEKNKWIKINNIERYLPSTIFGAKRQPVISIKHHIAHASSAYRSSGFKDCAVLVIDNRGENESSSLGYVKDGNINFFKQLDISQSLGIFYSRACDYTGLYGAHREVGKLMGLASYGKPIIPMPIKPSRNGNLYQGVSTIVSKNNYNIPNIRTKQLNSYFLENCFPYEQGNKEEIMAYANFASSAQAALENVILDFVRELKEKINTENIVIAGGVALNCSANGKVEQSNIFKNIYIPPFAGDAGTALGAALEVNFMLHGIEQLEEPLYDAGLGAKASKQEIISVLLQNKCRLEYKELEWMPLYQTVSEELSEGKIVAWVQGKFEIGPRALGHRSILADPRKRRNLIKLNTIKEREMWRPIAPSVLKEYYSKYFEGNPENKYFMNVASIVKSEVRKYIPAVVHVDYTARPQVVDKSNEKYYYLIKEFYKKTGIPILCNTSFNRKGEPLVNTPQDAVDNFLASEIDILVIENFFIKKIGSRGNENATF